MSTDPLVHHYDHVTGIYLGSSPAHASPLEPGVYLTPADATTIAPPAIPAGQVAVFAKDNWTLAPAPAEAASTDAETGAPSVISQIKTLEERQARPIRELAIAQAANDTTAAAAALTRIKGIETEIAALRTAATKPAASP